MKNDAGTRKIFFLKIIEKKKTSEIIYIPSLLLDCDSATSGSLNVEAVVALLPGLGERRGSG